MTALAEKTRVPHDRSIQPRSILHHTLTFDNWGGLDPRHEDKQVLFAGKITLNPRT